MVADETSREAAGGNFSGTEASSTVEVATEEQIWDTYQSAEKLVKAGNSVEGLHLLRSFIHNHKVDPKFTSTDNGLIQIGISPAWLMIRAQEAGLSFGLGQGTEEAYGWVAAYNASNPQVPEDHPGLRYYMDRLRMYIALENGDAYTALRWSLDLLSVIDDGMVNGSREEALANLAICADHLGLNGTAAAMVMALSSQPNASPQVKRLHASRLWSEGDQNRAMEIYREIIDSYEARGVENCSFIDLHHWAGTLRRRADGLTRRGDKVDGANDVVAAWRLVDRARDIAVYESARGSDKPIEREVRELLALTVTLATHMDSHDVVEAMLLIANSGPVGALRGLLKRERFRATFARERNAASLMHWAPIGAQEVQAACQPDVPTLWILVPSAEPTWASGLTLLVMPSGAVTSFPWSLSNSCIACSAPDCDPAATLRGLLRPVGSRDVDSSPWSLPANSGRLDCLGTYLLPPLTDIAAGSRLRIFPSGIAWQVPVAALRFQGRSLGAAFKIEFATPLSRPARSGHFSASRWLGHFDLRLPYAIADLAAFIHAAEANRATYELFDDLDGLKVALSRGPLDRMVVSCHGEGMGTNQRLLLAGGSNIGVQDIPGLEGSPEVILNCCWLGATSDAWADDAAGLALAFLVNGASGVLGSLGPIGDSAASTFLGLFLGTDTKRTLPSAVADVWKAMLDRTPAAPLHTWAALVPIVRGTGMPDAAR